MDGVSRSPSDAPIQAGLRVISVGYLRTAGILLLKGRDFTADDRRAAMPVAIVNESGSRRYWNGSDPLGRRLRSKDEQPLLTIVGVVADTKHEGLKADEAPVVCVPYAQKTQDWLSWATLLVRTAGTR